MYRSELDGVVSGKVRMIREAAKADNVVYQ